MAELLNWAVSFRILTLQMITPAITAVMFYKLSAFSLPDNSIS